MYYQYLARSTRLLDQPVGSLDGALALHPVYDTWVHARNLPPHVIFGVYNEVEVGAAKYNQRDEEDRRRLATKESF